MRNLLARRVLRAALFSSRSAPSAAASVPTATACRSPFSAPSRSFAVAASLVEEEAETVTFPREGPGVCYGLNWALASKGVIVKDKAFYNLRPSELQQKGTTAVEGLSGVPIHVRGNVFGQNSEISKAQFSKLLKQVASHISSVSNVFVQDGAVGSSPKCDAKVRIISDNPSALSSLSSVIWKTPTRAISHDSCPLTVYVATSMSQSVGDIIGLKSRAGDGLIVADVERSSLILCGKAFADSTAVKDALATLAAPIVSARGGLPLSARIFVTGDCAILFFASENIIKQCSELPGEAKEAGVILSSAGVAPFFRSSDSPTSHLLKKPASAIFISSDSSGALPSLSKLSPGQAAYHFLAGYQDGEFVPTYSRGPLSIAPLDLAKSFQTHLKDSNISSFLVNVNAEGKKIEGKELINIMMSTLSESIPENKLAASTEPKVEDLRRRFNSFIAGKFQDVPEEFSF